MYNVTPKQFNAYAKAFRKKGLSVDITKSDSVFYSIDSYDVNQDAQSETQKGE
jgi:hypothetical protein